MIAIYLLFKRLVLARVGQNLLILTQILRLKFGCPTRVRTVISIAFKGYFSTI